MEEKPEYLEQKVPTSDKEALATFAIDGEFGRMIDKNFENKKTQEILAEITWMAEPYINALSWFEYHNPFHIKTVCKKALELADDPKDKIILYIAWLFHDLGIVNGGNWHEQRSADAVKNILEEQFGEVLGTLDITLEEVSDTILATRFIFQDNTLTQFPTNKREEIMCDADVGYCWDDNFVAMSDNLRREMFKKWLDKDPSIDRDIWQIDFLNKRIFYTKEAKSKFAAIKEKHIATFEKRIEEKKVILLSSIKSKQDIIDLEKVKLAISNTLWSKVSPLYEEDSKKLIKAYTQWDFLRLDEHTLPDNLRKFSVQLHAYFHEASIVDTHHKWLTNTQVMEQLTIEKVEEVFNMLSSEDQKKQYNAR